MKTEREQLEENTRKEAAKQRAETVHNKILAMLEDILDGLQWERRASTLFFFTLSLYFFVIFWATYWFDRPDALEIQIDFFSTLMWVTLLRVYWHMARRMYREGKFEGYLEAMVDLGYATKDENDGMRKRIKNASPFKRFKEFWERVGQGNSKEAYGTT